MKRLFLLLVSVLTLSGLAWASPVDSTEARSLAQTFWRLHFPGQSLPVFENISPSVGVEHFYIFNNVNGPGFVMISGDDCAVPILGYSGTSNCVGGELSDNVRHWLDFYDNTIGAAVQSGDEATQEIADQWSDLRAGSLPEPKSITAVSPLIATNWNQTAPFNNLCPGSGNTKSAVGCVATAMAQVMKYHNWPTTGTGSYSYYCYNGTYDYGMLSANFGATTYDWNNMLNAYPNANSGTAAQQNAVATLMYHCGISVQMSYSPEWSGAFLTDVEIANSAYPNYPTTEKALKTYFKYSPSLTGLAKANYSNTQWISMLKSELDNALPVLYDGTDQNGQGGHCFVCDGYDYSNNFHFNWGWGGWYDGYFVLSSLTPGPGGTGAGNSDYSYNQTALFGVVPNNGSNPSVNTDLHVYSDFTYTPNPLQQNQTVSVEVNAANAGSSTFTGTIKLALLTANNTEAQVIGELSGSINSMTYAQLQYSGTVTVPAGTYQMALLAQNYGESNWTLLGSGFNYTNPITVTVTGGSTPPDPIDPTGCAYLHYPLPGTPTVYTADGGGYVSGSNVYGDEVKADYFTYSGTGTLDRIKITIGAMDGTQGSVVFKVWSESNGIPGTVLGSKTVTLSEIANNLNANNEYECVFSSPITVNGNFFAGLDVTNATSYFGLATTTDGTAANTGWEYYDNDWWTYDETWEMSLTNAIFPYVCSGTGPNPPDPTAELHVYSDFTYTPNPMQQNQSVSVQVNVANVGSSAYTGNLKLVLLNSNNVEAQVIGQSTISLNSSSFFDFQFSGTVTVPAGTYQMAVYAQATGASTWTLVGNGLNYPNPVTVTVTGGSNPPVTNYNIVMYEDFSYMPNPMQQNQIVTVNANVGNAGTGAFSGNFKLVLLTANNTEAQIIGQQNGSLNAMANNTLQFSNTVTVMPGTYQMALYYQASGESTWTLAGNTLGHANPVAVTVTGGSTPPVGDAELNMYSDFLYTPNPLKQNTVAFVSANVINTGGAAFNGSLRLALETSNDEYVQTIQQIPVAAPIAPNGHAEFYFSGNITAEPGFYKMTLYYKAEGTSNWIAVGNNYNAAFQNPKSVMVAYADGIDDYALETAKLRPNPATDHFYLNVADQIIDKVEVYSSTGQLVHVQKNVMPAESIGISFLKSGVYFVRYETSERVGTLKLIVK